MFHEFTRALLAFPWFFSSFEARLRKGFLKSMSHEQHLCYLHEKNMNGSVLGEGKADYMKKTWSSSRNSLCDRIVCVCVPFLAYRD